MLSRRARPPGRRRSDPRSVPLVSMVSPRPLLTAATTVVALLALAPAPAAASPRTYRVVDLGTSPEATARRRR
ncbi:hypothetical protein NKG94_12140 [Micromonospora sp. M12]